jgi:hypothetical protein
MTWFILFTNIFFSEIIRKMLHTPLPLPEIVHPTERFEGAMLPGLIDPRSGGHDSPIIPSLVRSHMLTEMIHPSAIEQLKSRLPFHTNGAMPSFHGPIIQLSGRKMSVPAPHDEEHEESVAEKTVKRELKATTSKAEAKSARAAKGKKNLSIKEHIGAGLD